MFICDDCKKVSSPKEKPINVIVSQRNVRYEEPGTNGTEITKEKKICTECSTKSRP